VLKAPQKPKQAQTAALRPASLMISSVLVILLAEWKLLPILIIDMPPFSLAVDDLKLLVAGECAFLRRHGNEARARTRRV
jgi:hypothetical protein